MVYLLDSNVLIYASRKSYPINGGEIFWRWILDMAACGIVSLPIEMYFEILQGNDALKHWISGPEIKEFLVLDEVISQEQVAEILRRGYAPDLTEPEIAKIGYDSSLIAYAYGNDNRTVVTREESKLGKMRANRRIPDVCGKLEVNCISDTELFEVLGFPS